MIKVGGIAITALVLSKVLARGAGELGLLLVILSGICILFLVADGLSETLAAMDRLAQQSQMDSELMVPILKTVVISVTTKITAELCRSAGEGGLASFVEFAGTVLALVVAISLIEGVMSMLGEML
ncbi:MAG: stage III sporulation AC/AD family protein [Eubacteriales bacterium]